MESITSVALDEICSSGPIGIPLSSLWPKLLPSVINSGLDLSFPVKTSIWSSLLRVPSIHFLDHQIRFECHDERIQSLQGAENIGLTIVADDHLRDSFLGLYDLRQSDCGISDAQRRALSLLGAARSDGITQSQLAKEFGKNGNNMFFIVKNLECQGLVTRRSAVIRTKDARCEGDCSKSSAMTTSMTNMVYLCRYAKHLGSHQRLEITKDRGIGNNEDVDDCVVNVDCAKEEILVDDFLPALKAICEKLEFANGKALLRSDIKKDLGYSEIKGHRRWRIICNRLKDAGVIEEFLTNVNNKEVRCVRLLKKFCPKFFEQKSSGSRDNNFEDHLMKLGHRHQITEQFVELPIEHRIYDMIDAEGVAGLTVTEVFRRLGISNKKNYTRLLNMVTRFGMKLQAEMCNKTKVYRVWTSGKFNPESCNTFSSISGHPLNDNCVSNAHVGDLHSHEKADKPIMLLYPPACKDYIDISKDTDEPILLRYLSASKCDDDTSEEVDEPILAPNSPASKGDIGTSKEVVEPTLLLNLLDSKGGIDTFKEVNDGEFETDFSPDHSTNGEYSHMLVPSNPLEVVDERNDTVPNTEHGLTSVATESDVYPLKTSSAALVKPPKIRSDLRYPCITMTAVSAQREQRILERLQVEKFILRAELHRWLESLESEKCTAMDRKTLIRMLNKLQKQGQCRCIDVSVPVATNCHHGRIIQVILQPSIYGLPPELLSQIYDRVRSFEMQVRRGDSYKITKISKLRKEPVLVLDHIKIASKHTRSSAQAVKLESMRSNGFLLAKMVRTKLFHKFIWDFVNSLPDSDGDLSYWSRRCDVNNPHSTYKMFVLDEAIKSIPFELFLQVVGTSQHYDDMTEKCKSGLRLSDFPVQDYKCLMDSQAMGRISWTIDILRRLKLIRVLTDGHYQNGTEVPQATLLHAMELKPYIEEPLSIVGPSSSLDLDLRPRKRHDFILADKNAVSIYWKALEYCYAAADPMAAVHSFPGSSVNEVFRQRAWWVPIQTMTSDECADLVMNIVNNCPGKKLSFQVCEKIASDLNLTLEQVLRTYHNKRGFRKFRGGLNAKIEDFQPLENNPSSSRKRKRSSKRQPLRKQSHVTSAEENLNMTCLRDDDTLQVFHEEDGIERIVEYGSHEKDEENYSCLTKCGISKKAAQMNRFSWTKETDRELLVQYLRCRAAFGAKVQRVRWDSLPNLPASKDACKRRMHILKLDSKFRQSLLRLCNILSKRYEKHLNKASQKVLNQDASRPIAGLQSDISDVEVEVWDDFDDPNIKFAFDELLQLKWMAKLETKQKDSASDWEHLTMDADEFDPSICQLDSSGTPKENIQNSGKPCYPSQKLSSSSLLSNYRKRSNERNNVDRQAYESLAVSNAVELFKLVFLSKSTTPEVPKLLAETLRRYSEHDIFIAFNYLKRRKIMVDGRDSRHSVLSQQFLQSIILSPFPSNTGMRASKLANWLGENEKEMMEEHINLTADLQCGDIFYLFSLISSGELSIIPCLPADGIGDAEESKGSKCKADNSEFYNDDMAKRMIEGDITNRREKGFPGITLSLSRETIPMANVVEYLKEKETCGLLPFEMNGPLNTVSCQEIESIASDSDYLDFGSTGRITGDSSESLWEAMTGYTEHLMSMNSDQHVSLLIPEHFRTLYSAIQAAGDQGLSMKEVSRVLGIQGDEIPELVIQALQTFGRALKVNAYDSVHVVDMLYHPKYFLTPLGSACQDFNPSPRTHSDVQMDLNMKIDDVHKVTILNLPEENVEPISECNEEVEYLKTLELSSADSQIRCRPILPWLNGDGEINTIVFSGLTRLVLGILMQNPGILEDDLICRMNILNPQSCRKLLKLLVLDNQVKVRKMHQRTSNSCPAIFGSILGSKFKKSKSVFRRHLFANPLSISLL